MSKSTKTQSQLFWTTTANIGLGGVLGGFSLMILLAWLEFMTGAGIAFLVCLLSIPLTIFAARRSGDDRGGDSAGFFGDGFGDGGGGD